MEILVFGAGSLGSLIGGCLARAHDVTLVGRDPHVSAVRDDGLRVTGLDAFSVSPEATTDGSGLSADLAVVTVKAFDTDDAARALATGSYEAVVSLQNGMGNEDVLASHLDCAVLAGATTYGAILQSPGVVEWTGRGDVVVGPWDPPKTPLAEDVATAFSDAGIDATVASDMRTPLWEKLAVNAAINPITALARVENGAVIEPPVDGVAREAAREAARTARADGVELSDEVAVERTEAVATATAANRSSMYQDVAEGRRTEIDAISGYVADRAADRGIDVPVTRTLFGLVRGWELGRDLR